MALLASLAFLATSGCDSKKPREHVFEGKILYWPYEIRIVSSDFSNPADLQLLKESMEKEFVRLAKIFSLTDADSEISKWNALERIDLPQVVAKEFYDAVEESLWITKESAGAFDVAMGPLIEMWGFGTRTFEDKKDFQPPSEEAIQAAMRTHSLKNVRIVADQGQLAKKHPQLKLNLNGIVKGAMVDAMSRFVRAKAIDHAFVRVDDELAAFGLNAKGRPWSYSWELSPQNVIHLRSMAAANAGDYRNFFVKDGKKYIHIIDPRTGHPVQNELASVVVVAPTCMRADAMSTALMVLGEVEGMKLVEKLPDVEAMFIFRGNEGKLKTVVSTGFQQWTAP